VITEDLPDYNEDDNIDDNQFGSIKVNGFKNDVNEFLDDV